MITGKKNILEWFRANKQPYFTIYRKGATASGQYVFKSDESESATPEDAVQELERCLNLATGVYTITAMPSAKLTSKGVFHSDIEIPSYEQRESISGAPAAAPIVDVQGAIDAALNKYKMEVELSDLRKENAELKRDNAKLEKESNPLTAQISGMLKEYAPMLIPALVGKVAGVPPVSGSPINNDHLDNEEDEEPGPVLRLTPEQSQRLGEVLYVFSQADPEGWLDTLEKMANKVQADPGILNSIKMFL